jgi:hypothetical protein
LLDQSSYRSHFFDGIAPNRLDNNTVSRNTKGAGSVPHDLTGRTHCEYCTAGGYQPSGRKQAVQADTFDKTSEGSVRKAFGWWHGFIAAYATAQNDNPADALGLRRDFTQWGKHNLPLLQRGKQGIGCPAMANHGQTYRCHCCYCFAGALPARKPQQPQSHPQPNQYD